MNSSSGILVFSIVITVAAYLASRALFLRFRQPLLNPVFLSTIVVIPILQVSGLTFQDYSPAKEVMTFLLGPATVALALPLYRHREALQRYALPILAGVAAGSLSTMATAIWLGRLTGLSHQLQLSLAPKSITAPIAMEVARLTGGDPSLAVAFVVATGMLGSMLGPPLLSRLQVANPVARGLAMGTTSHGQGTAMAIMEGETQGAMAGIAMALAAIFTSLVAPYYIPLLIAG
ncbi:MAG TPA: LrgB family protein [Geobacteraceae bacterium]